MPAPHRFTVAEYQHMGVTGVLDPDIRTELLDGEVVEMAPIAPPHNSSVMRFNAQFSRRFGDRSIVSVQAPMILSRFSMPEPDLLLLRTRSDFYSLTHPTPDDVLLAVEVADTSLASDRGRKLPLYASAGVAEVWIVDVNARTIEAHWEPSPNGYRQTRTAARGEAITPQAFPDTEIRVNDLVP